MHLEHLDDAAQAAFHTAQEIMHAQHHQQMDVEHVLLAVLRHPEGLAHAMLTQIGADIPAVIRQIEQQLERAPRIYGQHGHSQHVFITPRTQRLIDRARTESTRLNAPLVGVEHLLIAVADETDGISAHSLKGSGMTPANLEAALIQLTGTKPAEISQAAPAELTPPPAPPTSNDLLVQAQKRIAAMERQIEQLQEQLKNMHASLAELRGLLK